MNKIRRVICLLMAGSIAFSVCCIEVRAERVEKYERRESHIAEVSNNEILDICEEQEMEDLEEIDENLEIILPEDEFVEDTNALGNNGISTYAMTVPSGLCYDGIATSTQLVGNLSFLDKNYRITQNNTTSTYNFGSKLLDSFNVPGMYYTNVCGSTCYDMVPQGLTYKDGFFFVTAYCAKKEHNSVIYAIDSTEVDNVATLVMDNKIHAGGITYANNCLWIADTANGRGEVYYYSYGELRTAAAYAMGNSRIKSVDLENYAYGIMYTVGKRASFLTTYNGYLCVGEFNNPLEEMMDSLSDLQIIEAVNNLEPDGYIRCYNPIPSNEAYLTPVSSYNIPNFAQGAEFYKCNGYTYLLITTSMERINSTVHVYRNQGAGSNNYTRKKKIVMPDLLEETVTVGNKTYFIFESCAKKYRVDNDIPDVVVGKVCGFSTTFIYK